MPKEGRRCAQKDRDSAFSGEIAPAVEL